MGGRCGRNGCLGRRCLLRGFGVQERHPQRDDVRESSVRVGNLSISICSGGDLRGTCLEGFLGKDVIGKEIHRRKEMIRKRWSPGKECSEMFGKEMIEIYSGDVGYERSVWGRDFRGNYVPEGDDWTGNVRETDLGNGVCPADINPAMFGGEVFRGEILGTNVSEVDF